MTSYNEITDEREILLRTIDLLSMDVLRLQSENENLKLSIQALTKGASSKNGVVYQPESVWTKVVNYYRREGFVNTIKKIFSKLH